MTVLVFGSNGMIGNYICKYLNLNDIDTINYTRNDLDLNNVTIKQLNDLINSYSDKNLIIINAAGLIPHSAQKYNATDEMYYRVNSIFPLLLSRVCNEKKIKMIHITTDCVFDGKVGSYTEACEPTEKNMYGLSKSIGDIADCTVLRTSVIGEEIFNKKSLLEWVRSKNNQTIDGYDNHIWNGVTCLQLAKIIYTMIKNDIFWQGIRHIYSPNKVSKYELVVMIKEAYNLNININKTNGAQNIDKSISSLYDTNSLFNIPELNIQIKELSSFKL